MDGLSSVDPGFPAGHRPSSASPRIVYAFGHGHYGLTQSAATGRLVADMVAGRTPAIDVSPFAPQRFAKGL